MKKLLFISMLVCNAGTVGAQTNNPAPYCGGGFTGSTGVYIDSVGMVHNLYNIMQNPSGAPAYSDRYTYFSNKALPMMLAHSHTLRIKHAGDTAHFLAVYIDYNIDGDFNDAGERVFHRARTLQSPVPKDTTFMVTVPGSAMVGATRMRVIIIDDDQYTYGAGNNTATPCSNYGTGVYDQGECEDYNVLMATQPTITTLPATDITMTSAKIHGVVKWNGTGGSRCFTIDSGWPPLTPDNGPYSSDTVYKTLTGLQPYQTYSYAAGAVAVRNSGYFGSTLTFTTAPASVRDDKGFRESLYLTFPNPAGRTITIQTPAGAVAPTDVILHDAIGKFAGRFALDANGTCFFGTLPDGAFSLTALVNDKFLFRQRILIKTD